MGWVVFLLAAPYLALPAYLFLGNLRIPGYVSDRRALETTNRAIWDFDHDYSARLGADQDFVRRSVMAFEYLARVTFVSGNSVRLLIDGEATFRAIFEAIDTARSYVLVQFYILRDDELGSEFKMRLSAKARAGCTVRVLYDALGSYRLSDAFLSELRAAGVDIWNFHSIRRPYSRLQLNFRNHRKIVIVDGEIGFVGGLNVGDEYMGRDLSIGHWRDTFLRLEGLVVAQLQRIFADDWHWASEERPALNWHPKRRVEDQNTLIVATGPADLLEGGSLFFCNAINSAAERIWISSPYFVPNIDTVSALQLAAIRGVDVRILVSEYCDDMIVSIAGFAYFDEVRHAGVKILRYRPGYMHQKVFLVDDRFASVGTLNLDNRSCRLNFEVAAVVFDQGFASEVQRMLEADFANSVLYETPLREAASLLTRYGAHVARLFAPLL